MRRSAGGDGSLHVTFTLEDVSWEKCSWEMGRTPARGRGDATPTVYRSLPPHLSQCLDGKYLKEVAKLKIWALHCAGIKRQNQERRNSAFLSSTCKHPPSQTPKVGDGTVPLQMVCVVCTSCLQAFQPEALVRSPRLHFFLWTHRPP